MIKSPDKNSFILYCDQIEMFKKLSDDQAGLLIKIIYKYCGTGREHPDIADPLIDMVFTAIKTSLDRDYGKYLKIIKRNRDNGIKGGRPKKPKKPSGLFGNPKNPSKPDSDSDSDSVNESDNKKTKKSFKKYLEQKIIQNNMIETKDKIFEFYNYRMNEKIKGKKQPYSTEKGIDGLFVALSGCRKSGLIISECLDKAMQDEWLKPDPSYFKNNVKNKFSPMTRDEKNQEECEKFIYGDL